jgi:YcaO-like protein with predicted kinase domain
MALLEWDRSRIHKWLQPPELALGAPEAVRRLFSKRQLFGITRLGALTGLDRIGIPVAQAVRPESLSNSVSQGKGATSEQAAISALMECLEQWGGEQISTDRTWLAPPAMGSHSESWANLWRRASPEELQRPVWWIDGWDILTEEIVPVPLALVDTVYTLPSPHALWLPRNTTGLAAGTSLLQAAQHAGLEILERHASFQAKRKPHFFDRNKIDTRSVTNGAAGDLVRCIRAAGFEIGIWKVPAPHDLPIYWCQILEGEHDIELAPLPAEGFACAHSHDAALSKALLEACQSRLTVIAGARDDVTSELYLDQIDRQQLVAWRRELGTGGDPMPKDVPKRASDNGLAPIVEALQAAGAQAVILVPLVMDEELPLAVVRLVAPPLQANPDGD